MSIEDDLLTEASDYCEEDLMDPHRQMFLAAADTITDLRAEAEALRAALAPFAADAETYRDVHEDVFVDAYGVCSITVADVRRAAALLNDKEDGS